VNLTRHQIACRDLPHNYDDILTFGDTAKGKHPEHGESEEAATSHGAT